MYGPRDHFDGNSHVIPSMIKKFQEAKTNGNKSVTLWGTGKAKREFIYVEDAANALIEAIEKYNSKDPLNIGSGNEITIKKLAETVSKVVDYRGEITWDTSKPDGRLRRAVDSSRAKKEIGLKTNVDLDSGLKRTIDWYLENKQK